jgi:hypothetical protein
MEALERRLEAIERRLADGSVPAATAIPAPQANPPATSSLIEEGSIVSIVGLTGRTLIVLGGAFLIRFMTESQMLPQFAGTIVGITYALCWVFLAGRAARRAAFESATFHGISAAMIGFPLLWETTLHLKYLTPVESAAAVTIFTGIPLLVAWHREMRSFAMVIGAPAALTMLALGIATKTLPPFLSTLLLLGWATLILAYDRGWYVLAVFVAFVADFGVCLATVMRLLQPEGEIATSLGLGFLSLAQMALGAVYFGTFSALVFLRHRNLSFLEIIQVALVLLIGYSGFVGAALAAPPARTALGLSIFVLAAACYIGAYRLLRGETERTETFVVYSAAASTAALVGAYLTFRGATLPIVLALGTLACALVGGREKSVSLGVHGAVYISAAASASGLAWAMVLILSGTNLGLEFWGQPAPWVVFCISLAVMLTRPGTADAVFEHNVRRTRIPAMLLSAGTVGALVVSVAFALRSESGESTATEISILRTAVLSFTAVLFALLSRQERFAQSKWLVIPYLLAAALKLIAQDVPSGRPDRSPSSARR